MFIHHLSSQNVKSIETRCLWRGQTLLADALESAFSHKSVAIRSTGCALGTASIHFSRHLHDALSADAHTCSLDRFTTTFVGVSCDEEHTMFWRRTGLKLQRRRGLCPSCRGRFHAKTDAAAEPAGVSGSVGGERPPPDPCRVCFARTLSTSSDVRRAGAAYRSVAIRL